MKSFESLTEQGKMRRYHHMAHVALQSYPLTVNKIRCLTIRHNIIFRVDAQEGTFILRIGYPSIRTALMVKSEMRWLEAMNSATDLKLSTPIRTNNNDLMLTCELEGIPEKRQIVLMTWLRGKTVATNVTAEKVRQAGIALAKMHTFSAEYHPEQPFMSYDNFRCAEWGGLAYLEDANTVLTDKQKKLFRDAIKQSENAIEQWRKRDGLHLIHADFHFKNMNWYRNRLSLFDFDDCRWGHFLQDIGITLQSIQALPKHESLQKEFLTAYNSQRPINFSAQDLALAKIHRMMLGLTFIINYRAQSIAQPIIDNAYQYLQKHL